MYSLWLRPAAHAVEQRHEVKAYMTRDMPTTSVQLLKERTSVHTLMKRVCLNPAHDVLYCIEFIYCVYVVLVLPCM